MTNTQTFKEKLAIKLLKDNLLFDQGGNENGILDGDNTPEELEEFMKVENLVDLADNYLSEAFKTGYLKSHKTDIVLESKHLKFLGKEKLTDIKIMAAATVLGMSYRK